MKIPTVSRLLVVVARALVNSELEMADDDNDDDDATWTLILSVNMNFGKHMRSLHKIINLHYDKQRNLTYKQTLNNSWKKKLSYDQN